MNPSMGALALYLAVALIHLLTIIHARQQQQQQQPQPEIEETQRSETPASAQRRIRDRFLQEEDVSFDPSAKASSLQPDDLQYNHCMRQLLRADINTDLVLTRTEFAAMMLRMSLGLIDFYHDQASSVPPGLIAAYTMHEQTGISDEGAGVDIRGAVLADDDKGLGTPSQLQLQATKQFCDDVYQALYDEYGTEIARTQCKQHLVQVDVAPSDSKLTSAEFAELPTLVAPEGATVVSPNHAFAQLPVSIQEVFHAFSDTFTGEEDTAEIDLLSKSMKFMLSLCDQTSLAVTLEQRAADAWDMTVTQPPTGSDPISSAPPTSTPGSSSSSSIMDDPQCFNAAKSFVTRRERLVQDEYPMFLQFLAPEGNFPSVFQFLPQPLQDNFHAHKSNLGNYWEFTGILADEIADINEFNANRIVSKCLSTRSAIQVTLETPFYPLTAPPSTFEPTLTTPAPTIEPPTSLPPTRMDTNNPTTAVTHGPTLPPTSTPPTFAISTDAPTMEGTTTQPTSLTSAPTPAPSAAATGAPSFPWTTSAPSTPQGLSPETTFPTATYRPSSSITLPPATLSPSLPATSTLSPSINLPPPTSWMQECRMSLIIGDLSRNDKVTQDEYVRLVQRLWQRTVDDIGFVEGTDLEALTIEIRAAENFADLSVVFQSTFDSLAFPQLDEFGQSYIDVRGSKPGVQPSEAQAAHLENVCKTLYAAVLSVASGEVVTKAPAPPPATSVPTPEVTVEVSPSFFINCTVGMILGDLNRDNYLGEAEYLRFLNRLYNQQFRNLTAFDQLPPPFQIAYNDLAEPIPIVEGVPPSATGINVDGSKPGQQPTVQQSAHLRQVCRTTQRAMDHYLNPPTLSPTMLATTAPVTAVPTTATPSTVAPTSLAPTPLTTSANPSATPSSAPVTGPPTPPLPTRAPVTMPPTASPSITAVPTRIPHSDYARCIVSMEFSDANLNSFLDQTEYVVFLELLTGHNFDNFTSLDVRYRGNYNVVSFGNVAQGINITGFYDPTPVQRRHLEFVCRATLDTIEQVQQTAAPSITKTAPPVVPNTIADSATVFNSFTVSNQQGLKASELGPQLQLLQLAYQDLAALVVETNAGGDQPAPRTTSAPTTPKVTHSPITAPQTAVPLATSAPTAAQVTFMPSPAPITMPPTSLAPQTLSPSLRHPFTPPSDMQPLPEPVFASCLSYLALTDANQNDFLDQDEYMSFLEAVSGNWLPSTNFDEIDTRYQENYHILSDDEAGAISIQGARSGVSALTSEQTLHLTWVCTRTMETVEQVTGTPTIFTAESVVDAVAPGRKRRRYLRGASSSTAPTTQRDHRRQPDAVRSTAQRTLVEGSPNHRKQTTHQITQRLLQARLEVVGLKPFSAVLYNAVDSDCPANQPANTTCQTIFGSYQLDLAEAATGGTKQQIVDLYQNLTQQAIASSDLQALLDVYDTTGDAVTVLGPSTPLQPPPPATVPPEPEPETTEQLYLGMPLWALIVLCVTVFFLIVAIGLLIFIYLRGRKRKGVSPDESTDDADGKRSSPEEQAALVTTTGDEPSKSNADLMFSVEDQSGAFQLSRTKQEEDNFQSPYTQSSAIGTSDESGRDAFGRRPPFDIPEVKEGEEEEEEDTEEQGGEDFFDTSKEAPASLEDAFRASETSNKKPPLDQEEVSFVFDANSSPSPVNHEEMAFESADFTAAFQSSPQRSGEEEKTPEDDPFTVVHPRAGDWDKGAQASGVEEETEEGETEYEESEEFEETEVEEEVTEESANSKNQKVIEVEMVHDSGEDQGEFSDIEESTEVEEYTEEEEETVIEEEYEEESVEEETVDDEEEETLDDSSTEDIHVVKRAFSASTGTGEAEEVEDSDDEEGSETEVEVSTPVLATSAAVAAKSSALSASSRSDDESNEQSSEIKPAKPISKAAKSIPPAVATAKISSSSSEEESTTAAEEEEVKVPEFSFDFQKPKTAPPAPAAEEDDDESSSEEEEESLPTVPDFKASLAPATTAAVAKEEYSSSEEEEGEEDALPTVPDFKFSLAPTNPVTASKDESSSEEESSDATESKPAAPSPVLPDPDFGFDESEFDETPSFAPTPLAASAATKPESTHSSSGEQEESSSETKSKRLPSASATDVPDFSFDFQKPTVAAAPSPSPEDEEEDESEDEDEDEEEDESSESKKVTSVPLSAATSPSTEEGEESSDLKDETSERLSSPPDFSFDFQTPAAAEPPKPEEEESDNEEEDDDSDGEDAVEEDEGQNKPKPGEPFVPAANFDFDKPAAFDDAFREPSFLKDNPSESPDSQGKDTAASGSGYNAEASDEEDEESDDDEGPGKAPVAATKPGDEDDGDSDEESEEEDESDEEDDEAASEKRAEIEELVQKHMPDEVDNVGSLMKQFKGQEDQLIMSLRNLEYSHDDDDESDDEEDESDDEEDEDSDEEEESDDDEDDVTSLMRVATRNPRTLPDLRER